ncbi:MAG: threonine synthase [Pseudomonadota bacterium]
MKLSDFPKDVQPHLIPAPAGHLSYRCLGCQLTADIDRLLYVCPDCGSVLLIEDESFDRLKEIPGPLWHRIFDHRKMTSETALKGIYRYHEFIGPVMPLNAIVYLGEGHTPMIAANTPLQQQVGMPFYFKNDGQNPSASFKDRGMASALSYINFLLTTGSLSKVLAVCASTGDTSAAAALYGAYLQPHVTSAVLLPHGKVTPQQLSQPLGSGASVFEIPGVFDDCMKIVERLSETYTVALLNSKNAWRILGQESYSYEIAQDFEYRLEDKVVVVPIGNAGNITAVMNGFIKFYRTGIITALPKIIGVQSAHADPVYRYYQEPDAKRRRFSPVHVKPSTAQAAMIGNPVSMPRVIHLAQEYERLAGGRRMFVVQVREQDIMDWQLRANRNGHVACTHGGECLAGLIKAREAGMIDPGESAILDATAHAIKFSGFQDMYFNDAMPDAYEVVPNPALVNKPELVRPTDGSPIPTPETPLADAALEHYVTQISGIIAQRLALSKQPPG